MDKKRDAAHVEQAVDMDNNTDVDSLDKPFNGAVQITSGDVVYLIPTPSADPRDPLNLPAWRKLALLLCVSIYSTVGLSMVSALGGLFGLIIPGYIREGRGPADITHLLTYPTLFMGFGNIIAMPIVMAVGRRPVFLGSAVVLVLSGILCCVQKSYEWHLGARMVLGLAAGQVEALVPLMVQETQFLHERAKYLMYLTVVTNVLSATYGMLGSYIGNAVGVSGWYAIGTGMAGFILISSIFLVPETRYQRPLSAYQGHVSEVTHFATVDNEVQHYSVERLTTTDPRPLDTVHYKPRTLASDLRLFTFKVDWSQSWTTIKAMCEAFLFPDLFWLFILNGLTLGVSIAMSTTYADVLTSPPYNWNPANPSFVTGGQIIVNFMALPVLGQGSDYLIRYMARRNGGIHRPEFRLIPLFMPMVISLLGCFLYGQAASHPQRFHWFAIVFSYNAYIIGFIAASQVAMVYTLDGYPTRAGPSLVVVCAMRGILSFGTSYGITPFIALKGYDGAFLIYGLMLAAVTLMGLPIYFYGYRIRAITSRWAVGAKDKAVTYS